MADLSTPHADDAFAAETRRVVARRAGLGLGFMLGLAAVAGVLELAYYPDRLGKLAAAFSTEAILCAAALLAIRGARLRRFVVPITSAAAFAIVGCMTLYVVWAGASGDALAIALVLALSGVALLCPWGARAQVPLALGTLAAYLLALAHGVRGGLPVPYGILCVGGGAVTSILGPAHPEPPGEDVAALGGSGSPPAHLLRLPLEFRSELVGLILADVGGHRGAAEASFLDFAATLGNSAAMAIVNARLYALVREHRAELQRLSNKRLDMVEEGMRRISRELHDGTCQALMAINLDLTLLDRRLAAEAVALHGSVHDIRHQVLDVMHSMRQMSHLLHPPVLDDFGAVAAMESIAEKHRATSGLEVRVGCSDPGMRFTPAVELLLFRVFQEGLSNVVKHAAASRVDVRLTRKPEAVLLEIEDDGRGFDAHAYFRTPSPSTGLGLVSMRERVAHFGGALRVSARPGNGTRIVVRVPVEPLAKTKVAS